MTATELLTATRPQLLNVARRLGVCAGRVATDELRSLLLDAYVAEDCYLAWRRHPEQIASHNV
jgi:hypothetical protein